ncbi:Ig-like domain-containing protein [Actinoplanes sp. NPDC023936]|uniref:Ig-like domain-containing protein n=1 Tax=Actinoplanes sp. NPDC023936 TaxID=3154910 RepID=UPI003406759B
MRGRSAGILFLVLAVMLATLPVRVAAAITTAFTTRFDVNVNGSIMLRGNANLTCPVHLLTPTCSAARNGTGSTLNEELNNNGYPMVFTDADGDPATFNDSTATVDMPAGSTVLFAGLYWGADPYAGTSVGVLLGTAAPSPADRNKVLFRTPAGSTWNPITASDLYETTLSEPVYQGFADVTALVSGAGNGVYSVANIQAGRGKGKYAGWTLVIAYSNPAEDLRSLRVYDGFGLIDSGSTTIPVTGFEAPHSGPVQAEVGAVAYEGDLGKTGDGLQLNGQSLSDGVNPANNVFNSTASEGGAILGGRNPGYRNLFGVDMDQFNASGILPNAATSATLRISTSQETYYPGVITIAIDLYAPKIVTAKTATDLNGGTLVPGDEIEYRIEARNDGNDIADGVTLADAMPVYTTYVPSSSRVGGAAVTDAADTDGARVSAGTAVFQLGSIPYQGSTYVTFRVKVNLNTPAGYAISNLVNVSYTGRTTSVAVAAAGGTSATPVLQPESDLAGALAVVPAYVQRASTPAAVTYTATVTNVGPHPEPAARAQLTLPTGLTAGTLPAGCAAAGPVVTCQLGPVIAGHQASVSIPATAGSSTAADAVATVTAAGAGRDTVSGNNTGTASLAVNSPPVATADTAGTSNGRAVSIDVRANDTDPDDTVSTLLVSITAAPAHGTAAVASNGTINYTPVYGWTGADVFTYELNDRNGGTGTATVTVTTANAPPQAFDDERNAPPASPVPISVLANDTDPNSAFGDTLYLAAFTQPQSGEGTVTQLGNVLTYAPDISFSGRAHFTYTVEDSNGGQDTGDVYVDVENAAPTAADDAKTTPFETDVLIPVLDNDTDPNVGDSKILVSVDAPGVQSGSQVLYQPPAGYSGTVDFSYRMRDVGGLISTAMVTVTVLNDPPHAADHAVNTPYGTHLDVDVLAGATDRNLPPDTLRVIGVTNPADGTAVMGSGGIVRYTPDAGFSGIDHFDYTIDDGHGDTDTGRVTIDVANGLPRAVDDAITVQAGVPLAIDVMANDTGDPNGDPLTLSVTSPAAFGLATVGPGNRITYTPGTGHRGADAFGYTLSDGLGSSSAVVTIGVVNSAPVARPDAVATDTNTAVVVDPLANDGDPNGDALTLAGMTAAAHGTMTDNGDGTYTYTPETGFYGTDTIGYAIRDPYRLAASAVISITVRNAAPVALDDSFVAHPQVTTTLDVLGNDSDPNTGQELSIASAGPAGKGSAVLAEDGTLTYRSSPGSTGQDTFTYAVTDDLGRTDTGLVTITINGPPAPVTDSVTTPSGTPVDIPATANDLDPESEALTVVTVGTPGHGTAAINGDGTVGYAPDPAFAGTDTFPYEVRDVTGNTATGSISVVVENAPPIARPDSSAVLTGRNVLIDVLANDTDANIAQTLSISSASVPGHGVASLSGGQIRYAPTGNWTGQDTFTYQVSDGAGGLGSATVDVTVTDGQPIANPDRTATGYRTAATVPVLANDADPAGTLAVVAVTQPSHGVASFTTAAVRYVPADGFSGTDTFSYSAEDDAGTRVTGTVTITVGAPPAVPDRSAATGPGERVGITLPGTDRQGRPVTVTGLGTPAHGTVALNADGTVTYTPNPGFSGTDTFTYTVVDEYGNLAEATIEVRVAAASVPNPSPSPHPAPSSSPPNSSPPSSSPPGSSRSPSSSRSPGVSPTVAPSPTDPDDGPNRVPLIGPDIQAVTAGEQVTIWPLRNDTDPDGDPISLIDVGRPAHGTATASSGSPSGLAAARSSTDKIVYIPAPGFASGTDSFTYTIGDDRGGTATGTITVRVVAAADPLPVTGHDLMSLARIGTAVILTGTGLYILSTPPARKPRSPAG